MEKVTDSLLDKKIEGRETIKGIREINNKKIPSLSVETSGFPGILSPLQIFFQYFLKHFSAGWG
jgi:hypothetical protein